MTFLFLDTGKADSNEEGKALESNNKQFTYAEVVNITNNFDTAIGKGGFGTVYLGHLKNGSQVAVKLLSTKSSQGYKEFQNEVCIKRGCLGWLMLNCLYA